MNSTTQEKLLAQAERLCQQRNVRLTPQRLEVLRLMTQQPGAISAYDLLDLLRVAEPQAKPPTVYRALDFLLEQGFIHRVESANSYVLCHHFEQPMHTSALFICDRCGQVTERTTEGVEETLQKLAQEAGFALRHSVKRTVCAPAAWRLRRATASMTAPNTITASPSRRSKTKSGTSLYLRPGRQRMRATPACAGQAAFNGGPANYQRCLVCSSQAFTSFSAASFW